MSDDSNPAKNPVVLDMFPNPYIAEMIANMLKDGGVFAYVEGANLQDEVAFAQRSMGGLSVRVFVAQEQLEKAQDMVAAARAAGAFLAESEGDGEDDGGKGE